MQIEIPEFALVLLIGASGTGKSSFATRHFLPTEVVSSDRARGWVADDETDQAATGDAFDIVHAIIEKRLKNRRFTVVDATNVQPEGRASGAVRSFAMYGETSGEIDEFGLPVRYDWAADYKGRARVVYGHTPVLEAQWVNGTICIDTGCCFGGKLTALRYPEMELVSVPAVRTYYEPIRPLAAPPAETGGDHPHQLDIADVLGKQAIETRDLGIVVVREESAAAAIEVISRHAADPRWLIHLPPTMSPPETSAREDWLERPEEAFAYFGSKGIRSLVLQEKHMGSRGLVLLGRSLDAAEKRFGVSDGARGVVLTRTGRRFFGDAALEAEALHRVDEAMTGAGLWDELATDWALWDCEILPWSMKAKALLEQQYAPVGAAALAGLDRLAEALAAARTRGVAVDDLASATTARLENAQRYRDAYNRYVAPFDGIADLLIAPFHLLASEGAVHSDIRHNERAIRFYRKFGFEVDTAAELNRPVPSWIMRRKPAVLRPLGA